MKKTVLVFSALIIALLVLFQLSQYAIVSGNLKIEIIIAIIAIVFFFIGIYINKKNKVETSSSVELNLLKVQELEITSREYDVLKHISEGLSNKEIGEQLFVSESTVKTHVSNLLVKLNAKRRTQAVKIAKHLKII